MSVMKSWLASGIACALLFASALAASEQTAKKPAAPRQTFATPKEAADALIAAAAADDVPAIKAILGADSEDVVATEDPVQDKNRIGEFTAKAREKTTVVPDAKNKNLAILSVGEEDWPMPIPIVRNKSGKWFFDSKAGRREILHRRIGRRNPGLPRLRRGAARVRVREARRLEPEPVRAEDHQHSRQARRARVAQPRRERGRADR